MTAQRRGSSPAPDYRTVENLETLEADLGKPVIFANQATFADCLRILGLRQVHPGFGSLFARTFEAMEDPEKAISRPTPLSAWPI